MLASCTPFLDSSSVGSTRVPVCRVGCCILFCGQHGTWTEVDKLIALGSDIGMARARWRVKLELMRAVS